MPDRDGPWLQPDTKFVVALGAHMPHGCLLVSEEVQVLPDELLHLPSELGIHPEERIVVQSELFNHLLGLEEGVHYLYYMQSDPLLLELGVLHDAPEVQLLGLHQTSGYSSSRQKEVAT